MPTATVVTVNVALVAPAATVTLVGTVATDVLLLLSVTTAPPVGAALLNVTVPVEELPPVTLVGFRLTPERAAPGAVTVRFAEAVPLYVPEMLTEVVVPTATVVTAGFHEHGRIKAQNIGAPDLPLIVLPHPVGQLAPTDVGHMAEASLDAVLAALTAAKGSLRLDYVVNYTLPNRPDQADGECEDCKV